MNTRLHSSVIAVLVAALGSLGSTGCAAVPRFVDQGVVWKVDDTRQIEEPEEREFLVTQYAADILIMRRLERVFEVRGSQPAWNTNALDEVPDSSWFNNRIGLFDLSPDEIYRGIDTGGAPVLPLTVTSAKLGGTNPGFFAKDKTGRKFVIKFDPMNNLEMQTAASVIGNRFFWAIGFNVPSDQVFNMRRGDVKIGPDATVTDAVKNKHPFTESALDDILASAPQLPDGSYRASSSEFVKGKPKGGFAAEGTRSDDPNDVVPHEHRRELRGLRVFAAWLDHTDMKEDNGLDAYVKDNGRQYLRHHLIDFGEILGAHAAEKGRREDGFEHYWDWESQPKAIVAFGLWKRPWEDRVPSGFTSVGSIPTTDFDPKNWREAYPYWPFFETDAADSFWGAKIVMRFDRPRIEAAVRAGMLSSPEAAAYIVNALLIRREKIGRAYIEGVTPLDQFTVGPAGLCAIDLGTRYGLAHGGNVEHLDHEGKVLESRVIAADGRVCLAQPRTHYEAVRLRVRRLDELKPPMQVHVVDGARVVGIVRTE
jgi:hypothetical protein